MESMKELCVNNLPNITAEEKSVRCFVNTNSIYFKLPNYLDISDTINGVFFDSTGKIRIQFGCTTNIKKGLSVKVGSNRGVRISGNIDNISIMNMIARSLGYKDAKLWKSLYMPKVGGFRLLPSERRTPLSIQDAFVGKVECEHGYLHSITIDFSKAKRK
ncbi:hypothetical protein [Proteus mirabilis]|uniref:hypothetical protein n=1 Tax=Proteus mirabilis TaxID=584 RepID=UPI0034D5974B